MRYFKISSKQGCHPNMASQKVSDNLKYKFVKNAEVVNKINKCFSSLTKN